MSMTEWVTVNGARIDKAFFETNIREAKVYHWERRQWVDAVGHTHCIVCGITIGAGLEDAHDGYTSEGGWTCKYCYDNFVAL
jgi:hypothetical protein